MVAEVIVDVAVIVVPQPVSQLNAVRSRVRTTFYGCFAQALLMFHF